MRGRDGVPGFPEGLLLSLTLFSCKNRQSLTSAAGLPIGSPTTRRSVIGHWARCARLASLLPSLLHTGNAAMQRDDCLFLAVAAGEPSPLCSLLSDQTSAASASFCGVCEARRFALNTHHIPSLPKAVGTARRPFCTNPLISLPLFAHCLSLFSLVRRKIINMRTHTRQEPDLL